MDAKPWYLSKTLWVNLLGAVALIVASKIPAAAQFLKDYFAEAGAGWAIVNMILRAVTKDQLSIS